MNKKLLILLIFPVTLLCLAMITNVATYDKSYVDISTVKHNGYQYKMVYMNRGASGKRIKAKYFAAKDFNGNIVPERYELWAKNKNIICITSGTYVDDYVNPKPVGLTIDNGIVVNANLRSDMDGLVIVYPTGGIVSTNLKDKDLVVQGGSIAGVELDIRNNSFHRNEFLKWCKSNEATVFQTHLLVYKNLIKVSSINSSAEKRERRFLAVGKDENGNVVHCIVHSPEYTTLYDGTSRVLDFLNSFKELDVIFMVNLDTGFQDVFFLYDENGNVNKTISGRLPLSRSVNLLVYYYE